MSEGEALLAYYHDNPDDDSGRLIYADWLEENGDTGRAEFVHLKVQRALLWDGHPDAYMLEEREEDLPHRPEINLLKG